MIRLARALLVLSLLPAPALAQVANRANNQETEPSPADIQARERQTGTATPAPRARAEDRQVESIDRQLEGSQPPRR
jgi:hypothetical protein